MDKRELRKIVREKISGIKDKDRQLGELVKLFAQFLGRHPHLLDKYIMGYMPLADEPDVMQLFCGIRKLCLPLITADGKMVACRVDDFEKDLCVGPYGILQPREDLPVISPEEIGVIVVPGRAFDNEGNRLGRGKGFYDRFLKKTSAVKLALAYREQIFSDIPTDEHDVKMDHVLYFNEVSR